MVRRIERATRFAVGLAIVICGVDVTGVVTGYVGGRPDPQPHAGSQVRPPVESQSQPVAGPETDPPVQSSPAVEQFFSSYVDPSGRVIRKDQGGDTVSEGQAYALLLAAATGDRARFVSVWGWTQSHLQRLDGLLAWHWSHGAVSDWMPAADGDLDTAWALSLASRRFADPSLAGAARRMAGSILQEETVSTAIGPVLVAGPWARTSPSLVEPGYFSPEAIADLETLTHDGRWGRVYAAGMVILGRLAGSGLPPDWVSVTSAGAVSPVGAPGSASPPSFGLDAARAVVWAAACGAPTADPAVKWWTRLEPSASRGLFPLKMGLDGQPETSDVNPLIAIADAAAAQASGLAADASAMLREAARISAMYPTYYGSAWVALANSLLRGGELHSCVMG